MRENSNCCQDSLLEQSGNSQSAKMQYLPKSGVNNTLKTYSNSSAPLFGKPSSHDNTASVFRNTDVDHSIELQSIKDALIREWKELDVQDVQGLRGYLLQYIINRPNLAAFVRYCRHFLQELVAFIDGNHS